jgi:hypothetical protein
VNSVNSPTRLSTSIVPERILSRDVRGPNRIKPFRVDCGMVFISNKNFDDPGDFSPAIWSSMIPAIKQRCAIMSLSFERRHVIDYTLWLAVEGGMLKNIRFKGGEKGDLMLSRQKAYEVLEFVDEHLERMPDLTPRTLEKWHWFACIRPTPRTGGQLPNARSRCGCNVA